MAQASPERWIVGLTGKNASGKGEAAHFLTSKHYTYHSLSDILREEAKQRSQEPSREVLIQLGQELRRNGGPGVLAQKTVEKLSAGNYVIDSIRHPDEVEILKQAGHFFLIGIDAPIETRFERARSRGRTENASTVEEFQAMEDRERTNNMQAQQLDRSLEKADVVIQNTGTPKDLKKKVLKILQNAKFPLF